MSWVEDNLLVPGEIVHYAARAWGGWEYVITSRRLIAVKGKVFGKDVSEINLANVEYVEAKKGFLSSGGKIFIGSSSGNRDMTLDHVPQVMDFRRALLEAVDHRQS